MKTNVYLCRCGGIVTELWTPDTFHCMGGQSPVWHVTLPFDSLPNNQPMQVQIAGFAGAPPGGQIVSLKF